MRGAVCEAMLPLALLVPKSLASVGTRGAPPYQPHFPQHMAVFLEVIT